MYKIDFCFPVLIFTHTRLFHLKNCVDALLECAEAEYTDLYIASDGPRDLSEHKKIIKLRNFCEQISGFKSVTIIKRKKNMYEERLKTGTTNGLQAKYELLKKYEAIIQLEDDVIVHRDALRYLNFYLLRYKNEDKIGSVCCYLPPKVKNKNNEISFLRIRTPYCIGVWAHKEVKYKKFRTDKGARAILASPSLFKRFALCIPHCVPDLFKIIHLNFRPGDTLICVHFWLKDIVSVFPPFSLSKSIGHDGSGLHSGRVELYQSQSLEQSSFEFKSSHAIEVDTEFEKDFHGHYITFKNLLKAAAIFLVHNFVPQLCIRKLIGWLKTFH